MLQTTYATGIASLTQLATTCYSGQFAHFLACRYEGGEEIVRGYEAYQEALKAGSAKKAAKTLAPQTQEPYTLAATETQSQYDDALFQTRCVASFNS